MTDKLIIFAHPGNKGYCTQILADVKKELDKNKDTYEILDLYKIGYNPVLKFTELYSSGKYEISDENLAIQEKVKNSDLIFIYPVWWGTMPAILKGFIDRLFVAKFAFTYKGVKPKPLLKGKKALVFITTGSPTIFSRIFQSPVRHIKKEILGFCGINAKVIQIGNAKKLTEKEKNLISKKVKVAIKWL